MPEEIKGGIDPKKIVGGIAVIGALIGGGFVGSVVSTGKEPVIAIMDADSVIQTAKIDTRKEIPQGAEMGAGVFPHSFVKGDTLVMPVYKHGLDGKQQLIGFYVHPITENIPADRIYCFRDAPVSMGLFPKPDTTSK
jgi:hypothetical protein